MRHGNRSKDDNINIRKNDVRIDYNDMDILLQLFASRKFPLRSASLGVTNFAENAAINKNSWLMRTQSKMALQLISNKNTLIEHDIKSGHVETNKNIVDETL